MKNRKIDMRYLSKFGPNHWANERPKATFLKASFLKNITFAVNRVKFQTDLVSR